MARMLALDAHPMGLGVSVLTPQSSDPAAQVVGNHRLGALSDESDLRKFLADVNALTFESEFVDIPKLRGCLPKSVYVFPSLDAIEAIQDRLTQKQWLDRFEIPTSPWIAVETKAELDQALVKYPDGFVLKQRRFGYDGYGTFVVKGGRHDPMVLQKTKHGFIAEKFVDFKRELAVSFVRGRDGQFLQLPLVESVQVDSRCFSVVGPVAHRGLKALAAKVKTMMIKTGYVGILAVELFDTPKGLLVNELAPRVHNSAHYSQDGLRCSQFEYHLRAGLGFPLPKVQLRDGGFAMVNLLGEGKGDVELSREFQGRLHWYGKNENRAGRKLGHINVTAATPKLALTRALKWRKAFSL